MNIFIASDHGGLEVKNIIIEYLQNKNIRVDDMGPYELNTEDDYPIYAQKVAKAVLQDPVNNRGIVLCRSGVGVDITVNRFKGIRSALGFNETQLRKAREDDDVNILSVPSEYLTKQEVEHFVDIFLTTPFNTGEKYLRRVQEIDAIT